jgi:hypothetical protein
MSEKPDDKADAQSSPPNRWKYVVICAVLAVLAAFFELNPLSFNHRFVDAWLFISAGALGIAFGQEVMKNQMEISRGEFRARLKTYLEELQRTLEGQMLLMHVPLIFASAATVGRQDVGHAWRSATEALSAETAAAEPPVPLPIPYIISRLGDGGSSGFGYFAGKLAARDPRLLLDLLLDQVFSTTQKDKEIWELTKRITTWNAYVKAVADKKARTTADVRASDKGGSGPQSSGTSGSKANEKEGENA